MADVWERTERVSVGGVEESAGVGSEHRRRREVGVTCERMEENEEAWWRVRCIDAGDDGGWDPPRPLPRSMGLSAQ